MNDIEIFKNIVFYLKDWYMEKMSITEIDEFNQTNDLNILKIIKLHFFVVAINSKNNDLLLNNNEFHAMPYGPVETNVYNTYKLNPNFTEFTISNEKIFFLNNPQRPELPEQYSTAIIESINALKKIEPELILADAGLLVELTHAWNSWKKNYNLARLCGKYSHPIPKDEIKNDLKIVNLNFIN